MLRLIALAPALLLATGAFAQTMPEDAHRDLWCGTALNIVLGTPEAATDEEKAAVERYLKGAAMLLERGSAAMLAAGFTQEAVDKAKADLLEPVGKQVTSTEPAEFSPDVCGAMVQELLATSTQSSEPEASSAPAQ